MEMRGQQYLANGETPRNAEVPVGGNENPMSVVCQLIVLFPPPIENKLDFFNKQSLCPGKKLICRAIVSMMRFPIGRFHSVY